MIVSLCSVAAVTGPLFGNPWLALLAIVAGIAVFMAAVAWTGRWLAATHPSTAPVKPTVSSAFPLATAQIRGHLPPPEILAIIAASVRVTFGAGARIAEVVSIKPAVPSVEMLMQQWSMEGRRQIYSSHQIR